MLVSKLVAYALVYPVQAEEIDPITGTGANTLSALTTAASGTFTDPPDEPDPEPEPTPSAVVRLRVDLMGQERRTISLNGTVRRI